QTLSIKIIFSAIESVSVEMFVEAFITQVYRVHFKMLKNRVGPKVQISPFGNCLNAWKDVLLFHTVTTCY
ncbi:MAG TPA: hypothetical protein VM260_00745, partial [Pirellula sp.]|nr:hypothetical protein [Pirellula sp.]